MPKILKILTNPNPILRQKSLPLNIEELKKPETVQLLLDMEETMLKKDGAGLAAPQIGKNIRVIVIRTEDKNIFLINPRLTKKSWAKEVDEEGCLSVLNEKGEIIYAPVERYKKVNCLYWDRAGKIKKASAEGILARVIQHEIDHLDGILFIDKLYKKGGKKTLPQN